MVMHSMSYNSPMGGSDPDPEPYHPNEVVDDIDSGLWELHQWVKIRNSLASNLKSILRTGKDE